MVMYNLLAGQRGTAQNMGFMLKAKVGNMAEKFCKGLKPHPATILYYKFVPVFCLYFGVFFLICELDRLMVLLYPCTLPQHVQCRKENLSSQLCFLGDSFPARLNPSHDCIVSFLNSLTERA